MRKSEKISGTKNPKMGIVMSEARFSPNSWQTKMQRRALKIISFATPIFLLGFYAISQSPTLPKNPQKIATLSFKIVNKAETKNLIIKESNNKIVKLALKVRVFLKSKKIYKGKKFKSKKPIKAFKYPLTYQIEYKSAEKTTGRRIISWLKDKKPLPQKGREIVKVETGLKPIEVKPNSRFKINMKIGNDKKYNSKLVKANIEVLKTAEIIPKNPVFLWLEIAFYPSLAILFLAAILLLFPYFI